MSEDKEICPYCKGNQLLKMDTADVNIVLVECAHCGIIAKQKIHSWDENFGKDIEKLSGFVIDYNSGEDWRRRIAVQRLNLLKSLKPSGKILDFGCASGFFLDEASKINYKSFGIDNNTFFLDYAKQRFPDIAFSAEIDVEKYRDTFDIITIFDSIGYVLDIASFLRKIVTLLKKGGFFFLSTLLPDDCLKLDSTVLTFNYYLKSRFVKEVILKFGFKLMVDWIEPKNINTTEPYSAEWWHLRLGIKKQTNMSNYMFEKL
jgi:SAM-dependent methyltransferase